MSTTERVNELLNLAHQHYGVDSDRQLARCLEVDESMISRMRRGLHLPPQARLILILLNAVIPGPLPVESLQVA